MGILFNQKAISRMDELEERRKVKIFMLTFLWINGPTSRLLEKRNRKFLPERKKEK